MTDFHFFHLWFTEKRFEKAFSRVRRIISWCFHHAFFNLDHHEAWKSLIVALIKGNMNAFQPLLWGVHILNWFRNNWFLASMIVKQRNSKLLHRKWLEFLWSLITGGYDYEHFRWNFHDCLMVCKITHSHSTLVTESPESRACQWKAFPQISKDCFQLAIQIWLRQSPQRRKL